MKKKIEAILEIIRKMESNTFLLKDSWSDNVELINSDYIYKTYVGRRGDTDRYIVFEIRDKKENIVKVSFFKNNVSLEKPLELKFSIDDVIKVLEEIFNEMHSFKNHSEGLRKVKQKITEARNRIKSSEAEIKKLNAELEDYKKLQ